MLCYYRSWVWTAFKPFFSGVSIFWECAFKPLALFWAEHFDFWESAFKPFDMCWAEHFKFGRLSRFLCFEQNIMIFEKVLAVWYVLSRTFWVLRKCLPFDMCWAEHFENVRLSRLPCFEQSLRMWRTSGPSSTSSWSLTAFSRTIRSKSTSTRQDITKLC